MRIAKIQNEVVVDVLIANMPDAVSWCNSNMIGTYVNGEPDANIGDGYQDGTFIKPPTPPEEP